MRSDNATFPRRWRVGDRVTRRVFLDDGTWQREGDECLPRSPLRRGTVIEFDAYPDNRLTATVRWDDGETRRYLPHGIEA